MKTRARAKTQGATVVISKQNPASLAKAKDASSVVVSKPKTQTKAKAKGGQKSKLSMSKQDSKRSKSDGKSAKLTKKSSTKQQKSVSSDKEESKNGAEPASKYGQPKSFTKHESKVAKLTEWIEITVMDFYQLLKEEKKHAVDIAEEEICPICRCEIYDDIIPSDIPDLSKDNSEATVFEKLDKLGADKIAELEEKQLEDPSSIDIVKFKECANHFYHKGCAEAMIPGSTKKIKDVEYNSSGFYLKCAVCMKIYGEYIGDSPPGTMTWTYYAKGQYPLESYEKLGTWYITYNFPNGKRNGVKYGGTGRHAFLPDTQEGKEVLLLLIKSFQRKHTFTVGDSVTTGAKNVVVWNSIHHKTSTHGGTLSFGYPDPTYFSRVKLELANKGVALEPSDDINKIKQNGSVKIS